MSTLEQATHSLADRQEALLAAELTLAFAALREHVTISKLVRHLNAGKVKAALDLLKPDVVDEAFEDAVAVLDDTFDLGGRLGASQVPRDEA